MARAIWSGSISFGLVNIPVKLFAALRDRDVRFHLMSGDGGCRLHRKLVCPETGREYEFNETAKGYEIAPDQYVLVTDEELEQLRPERGRTIEISDFVEIDQIDPVLFDRPYYLTPEKNGAKPYRLLLEALRESGKVAICRFMMRTKEYLAALRPIGDALCIETMRFADEVVPVDEIGGIPEEIRISERELAMADQLIESLTTTFDPESYRDDYRERVLEMIERKAEGKTIAAPKAESHSGKVIDLMEALRKSLADVGQENARATKARPAASTRGKGHGVTSRAKKSSGTKSRRRGGASGKRTATASGRTRTKRAA